MQNTELGLLMVLSLSSHKLISSPTLLHTSWPGNTSQRHHTPHCTHPPPLCNMLSTQHTLENAGCPGYAPSTTHSLHYKRQSIREQQPKKNTTGTAHLLLPCLAHLYHTPTAHTTSLIKPWPGAGTPVPQAPAGRPRPHSASHPGAGTQWTAPARCWCPPWQNWPPPPAHT